MCRCKKLISVISAFVLSVGLFNLSSTYSVYADDSKFKSDLETFIGHEPSEDELHQWSGVIMTLKNDGISDEGVAGVCGNILAEGGNCFAIEAFSGVETKDGKTYADFKEGGTYDFGSTKPSYGYSTVGEGHGLCQWSFGRADNLIKFAEDNNCEFATVTHWRQKQSKFETCKLPGLAGQTGFILEELHGSYSSVYNSIKSSTSVEDACRVFHDKYEVSATGADARIPGAKRALAAVKSCDSVIGGSSGSAVGNADMKQVADIALTSGFWDEDQFVTFCGVIDTLVEFPDFEDLDIGDRHAVREWQGDLASRNENEPFKVARVFVAFLGILITVYSVFLYVAWQFDRNQNFIEFSLLGVLTLGHLTVAPEDTKSTYTKENKTGQRTVSHKDIITISVLGVAFGVLILSGKLYSIILWAVSFVKEKLRD